MVIDEATKQKDCERDSVGSGRNTRRLFRRRLAQGQSSPSPFVRIMTNNQEKPADHGNGMAWRRRRPSIIRPRRQSGKILIAGDTLATRHQEEDIDLDWYSSWLSSRLLNLPATVASLQTQGKSVRDMAAFDSVCGHVESYLRGNRSCGINDVVEHLQESEVFDDNGDDDEAFNAMRLLVFSALGWKSMIYQPEFNVCTPDKLAIHHDNGPNSGLVFDMYKVPADMCDRPLFVLLKCFGNLLPARSSSSTQFAVETSKTAASWVALYPSEVNAYLLHTLLGVRFRWVDSIALHLDYDKSSRTLSIFCFPSICASQLESRSGTIFAFASTEKNGVDPRADEDDIAHLLEEILLSYRLLFGQCEKSRKLFRVVFDPANLPFPQPDTLLHVLCGQRQLSFDASHANLLPRDRRVYYAARDFPVLYERVELLAKELSGARPKSMSGLLRDRRDTLQFWTFWLVALFGGLSISLAIIQTILQAIQIAQQAGKI
ncbi:hypothetical protein BFJ63_vAg14979 [Fusarium oxysporum f. sp. narcissi]|uniref:Uncharacterized protein n=1 Tax=Fusarium oxysporum f. sp. narcissi TaxID=451672 RepID=A0A4Q2VB75_FUSOX|nr:hypothetical protein BFJ63_vAg14979 [Fusarium oxysporum f. sp. narcissi]